MLISPAELQRYWNLHPDTVIHIGAHEAEELELYTQLGWGATHTVWVEALADKAEAVRRKTEQLPNHTVMNIVAWNATGETVTFNEASNGESSSALEFGTHATVYPNIVFTDSSERTTHRIVDALDFDALGSVGLVNLDIQGAELKALQGFGDAIDRVEAIYSEVNTAELYVGCAQLTDLDEWLSARGFVRADWEMLPQQWGDALWLRSSRLPADADRRRKRRVAMRRIHTARTRLRARAGRMLHKLGLRR